MRRLALLLAATLALLLLGAAPVGIAVLPPSAQTAFEHVMHAVNERHALGVDTRITDIAIKKQLVVLQFEINGQKLVLHLVHLGAGRHEIKSRYFAFDYDQTAWSGHRAELQQLAGLLDHAFVRTPWFIPEVNIREESWLGSAWLQLGAPWLGLQLKPGLCMTLFGASWLLGLAGVALLLRRRRPYQPDPE